MIIYKYSLIGYKKTSFGFNIVQLIGKANEGVYPFRWLFYLT